MVRQVKNRKSFVFFALILVFLLFGTVFSLFNRNGNDRLPSLNASYLLDINSLSEDQYDEASGFLLDKKTYLSSSFTEHYDTSSGEHWNGKYNNTYRLYIQSLYDVSYLTTLYRNDQNSDYLEEANRLINGWLNYSESVESEENEFLWYDHSVSYRTMSLISFFYTAQEANLLCEDFKIKLNDVLYAHGVWLYDPSNYSDGNHGLMMDSALLQLSLHFGNKNWFNRSLERINSRIEKDYSSEGVHLENSPEYHVMVTGFYYKIWDFLQYYELDAMLTRKNKDIITKMPLYLLDITLPTGNLPTIGDSEPKKVSNPYNNEYLEYLVSDGKSGKKPQKGLKFYGDAGIATYRESWELEEMDDSIWWSFKCGGKNRMHRQDDDLSFILFADGYEIFSDAGKYSYEEDDPFRKFVVSPQGHTSVSLLDKAYYARPNFKVIECLELIQSNEKYAWLRGVNRSYDSETLITRDFIHIYPNIFVILDRIDSTKPQVSSQQYILGENVSISSKNSKGITIKDKDENMILSLSQHIPVKNVSYFYADDISGKGYISKKFKEKIPVDYVEFSQEGSSMRFLTTIVLSDLSKEDVVKAEIVDDKLNVYLNGGIIMSSPIDL